MDSFEFNKIAGAVLASLLVLLGIGMFLAPTLYHAAEPEQQAYVVEGVEVEGEGAAAEAPAEQSIEELIQLATIELTGKALFSAIAIYDAVNFLKVFIATFDVTIRVGLRLTSCFLHTVCRRRVRRKIINAGTFVFSCQPRIKSTLRLKRT